MKKQKLLTILVLTLVLLAGCGKKPDNETKNDVTNTPTPTRSAEQGTPTPEPTEEPVELTGTPLERILAGLHNAFADGNYTVTFQNTVKKPEETDPSKTTTSYRVNKCEDGELVFKERIDEDNFKMHEYIFLQPNGGIHMNTWWGDSKMNYEYVPISKEDASHMYELVYGLHEPGDEALRAVLRMGADIFPDWPKKLAPENAAFATLLAPFASTEALEEKFGYHQTEDGTDVFVVRKDQIGSFLASVESDFVGLRYYLGEQQIMVLSDVGDIEVTVTFDGTFLSGIALHYKLSDGTKAEQKMTITDIGKTEISLPSAAKEKFESLKFDAGSEEEPSNWISWLKQYQLDAIEGRVDKDVATINTLLQSIWECVKDPAINAELKEMIAKEKDQELIIYYSEGSNYDKTGVASIDAKLKEKFGNAKIKMESVMWVPLSLQIYFIADGPDGSVQMYYNLD